METSNFFKVSTIFIATLFLCSCSTTFKVTSDPVEASVSLVTGENEKAERKLIGKTPLEMPMEEFSSKLGKDVPAGGFFKLAVSKEGFEEELLSLPASSFGTRVSDINVKLKKNSEEKAKELKTAQDILNQLFLAQRFARAQQFERALIELDKILTQQPTFARALSMKGSIYFAQKNYAESIKWYEEAIKADPQMDETIKLLARARDVSGSRAPSQVGGKK
jgi:tetratricopeptide (TPR) repeat protein